MVDTSSIPLRYDVDMDDVRWLNEREERAWRSLQFMQMRLDGALARQLAAESGLSYPDYVVLVALTDRPDGRLRLFELAPSWDGRRAGSRTTSVGWPTAGW